MLGRHETGAVSCWTSGRVTAKLSSDRWPGVNQLKWGGGGDDGGGSSAGGGGGWERDAPDGRSSLCKGLETGRNTVCLETKSEPEGLAHRQGRAVRWAGSGSLGSVTRMPRTPCSELGMQLKGNRKLSEVVRSPRGVYRRPSITLPVEWAQSGRGPDWSKCDFYINNKDLS